MTEYDGLLALGMGPSDSKVDAYVATVPEPAAIVPLVAALGGWCLLGHRVLRARER